MTNYAAKPAAIPNPRLKPAALREHAQARGDERSRIGGRSRLVQPGKPLAQVPAIRVGQIKNLRRVPRLNQRQFNFLCSFQAEHKSLLQQGVQRFTQGKGKKFGFVSRA
jgi:hypothetical protein